MLLSLKMACIIIIFTGKSPMQTCQNTLRQSNVCGCGAQYTFMHFQKYCEKCRTCPIMIEEDVKIVPSAYRPNSQDYKLTSVMVVEQHIRDILHCIDTVETQANINQCVDRVLYVHRKGQTKRGYKEKCAALIYSEYQQQHKMTLYQFCRKTGIEVKKFNKKFLEYKRILNESRERERELNATKGFIKKQQLIGRLDESQDGPIKREEASSSEHDETHLKQEEILQKDENIQEKNSEQSINHNLICSESSNAREQQLCGDREFIKTEEDREKLRRQSTLIQNQDDNQQQEENVPICEEEEEDEKDNQSRKEFYHRSHQQIQQTLKRLYDEIFPSLYMQANKAEFLSLLLERILAVNEIWEQKNIGYPMKEFFRIPCLIFGVIIANKHKKISHKEYIEAVDKVLGITLVKTWLTKFAKMCKQIVKEMEGKEDLTEVASLQNATCSAINNNSSL